MKAAKLKELRTKLEEKREELKAELGQLSDEIQWLGIEQAIERGGLGNHLGDDGSSLTEQERIATVRSDIEELLQKVDAALERMDEGTYGICERCHKPINEERLEAFPYVQFCIECQSFLERQHAMHRATDRVP
ncbi:MAG TPA: TraR/DksA C4-type zinc finger protein [Thermomicrobiales bacterium]